MGDNAQKSSAAPDDSKSGFIGMKLSVGIGVVLVALMLVFWLGKGAFEKDDEDGLQGAAAPAVVAPSTTIAATTTVTKTIDAGVVCPSFSALEKRTCTFDDKPTAAIGADTGGMTFCYDKPHGKEQTYSRQRWDSSATAWVDWPLPVEGGRAEKQHRLKGNLPGEAVTITYWLAPDATCPSPGVMPVEVEKTEEVTIVESKS